MGDRTTLLSSTTTLNNVQYYYPVKCWQSSNITYCYILSLRSHLNVILLCVAVLPPTNVQETVIGSRSIQVSWGPSPNVTVTGYLISYTTTASYAVNGNVTVNGRSTTSGTLNNLEEDTPYNITVQAISVNGTSANSNKVSVTTYTDGK